MREPNKCVSVRNDEIIKLHMRSGAGPCVSISCLHRPHLLIPCPQTINQEKNKESRNEIKLSENPIVVP